MSDEPLVSICIPNHNYARYLPQTLDAALSQTYPRVEVIVVDNGSVDDSRDVLERYRDRVTVEYQTSQGQARGCNRAFELSHGDIVMFHDADDRFELDGVARIVDRFADPAVSMVLGRMRDIDGDGNPLPGTRPEAGRRFWGGDLRPLVLEYACFTWPETTAQSFRRTVLEDLMPIPGDIAPDMYLSHLAALAGRVAIVDRPIASYRLHGRNKRFSPRVHGTQWLDLKIAERRVIARSITEHAVRLGLIDGASAPDVEHDPSAPPHDFIRAGLELARARVDHERGAWRWAVEGVRSIARHPQFSVRSRLPHLAWFVGAGIAPPSVATRLVHSRYPFTADD